MLSRLHELDLELFRLIHHGIFGTPLESVLEIIQNGAVAAVVAATGVALVFFFGPRPGRRSILLRLVVPIALAALSVQALKHVVNEPRPAALYPALVLNKGDLPRHSYSWPSGHAAGVFSTATAILLLRRARSRTFPRGERAPRVWLVATLLAFVAAFLTGLARVACGAHFPADVISGAALGALVVLLSVPALDAFEDRFFPLT
jgi:membrane-associated phospholipid phosphatase